MSLLPTWQVPALSRMTIALMGTRSEMEQVRRQLEDVLNVWAVVDYSHVDHLERELFLVKVRVAADTNGGGNGRGAGKGKAGGGRKNNAAAAAR